MASEASSTTSAQRVEVVVRKRPANTRERALPNFVDCVATKEKLKQVTVKGKGKAPDKTFGFDRVFGPHTTQMGVFNEVARPLVDSAMEGYNGTIFCYGQTGTGKTHTMEGVMNDEEQMGIIPRSVHYILEALQASGSDFSVKATYLQVYNEQLHDLFDPLSDKTLTLADVGGGARKETVCQNLKELTVENAKGIFEALKAAVDHRVVASTSMNDVSSRSHSIFTMRIHIKETTPHGEDLLKTGRLNLIDLAGSECVGTSNAVGKQAREAGNINKSLQSLKRVITALVQRQSHVPYRDSKLTRLLKESLGGTAKTCLIATVSPDSECRDETNSTLDYMHTAKNIKNKPQINQKRTQREFIKSCEKDMMRLQEQLAAQRDKSGVYLPVEQHAAMEEKIASQAVSLEELGAALEATKEEMAIVENLFEEKKIVLDRTKAKLETTAASLEEAEQMVTLREGELVDTRETLADTEAVLDVTMAAEVAVRSQGEIVQTDLCDAASHVSGLFSKVARVGVVEQRNAELAAELKTTALQQCEALAGEQAAFGMRAGEQAAAAAAQLSAMVAQTKAVADATAETFEAGVARARAAAEAARSGAVHATGTAVSGLGGAVGAARSSNNTTLAAMQAALATALAALDAGKSAFAAQHVALQKVHDTALTHSAAALSATTDFADTTAQRLAAVKAAMEAELAAARQDSETQRAEAAAHEKAQAAFVDEQKAALAQKFQAMIAESFSAVQGRAAAAATAAAGAAAKVEAHVAAAAVVVAKGIEAEAAHGAKHASASSVADKSHAEALGKKVGASAAAAAGHAAAAASAQAELTTGFEVAAEAHAGGFSALESAIGAVVEELDAHSAGVAAAAAAEGTRLGSCTVAAAAARAEAAGAAADAHSGAAGALEAIRTGSEAALQQQGAAVAVLTEHLAAHEPVRVVATGATPQPRTFSGVELKFHRAPARDVVITRAREQRCKRALEMDAELKPAAASADTATDAATAAAPASPPAVPAAAAEESPAQKEEEVPAEETAAVASDAEMAMEDAKDAVVVEPPKPEAPAPREPAKKRARAKTTAPPREPLSASSPNVAKASGHAKPKASRHTLRRPSTRGSSTGR